MFTKTEHLPGEGFYAQVPLHWIRDHRLRAMDFRVLSYCQSHAVGYRLTVEQVVAELYEARDAVYAAIGRLIDLGYFVRYQPRDEQGKTQRVEYTFGPAAFAQQYERRWGAAANQGDGSTGADEPLGASDAAATNSDAISDVSAGQTASGFSGSGFSGSGFSGSGKPDTKKISSKKISSKNITTTRDGSTESDVSDSAGANGGGGESDHELNPKAAEILDEAIRRAGITTQRRPRGAGRRALLVSLTRHLTSGWTAAQLVGVLGESYESARSIPGAMRYRLEELGAPEAPEAPQTPSGPKLVPDYRQERPVAPEDAPSRSAARAAAAAAALAAAKGKRGPAEGLSMVAG